MTADTTISAVLLAAGESRRMGDANKLLLPIAGEPLVRRTARRLLAAGVQELVVVLGHERARVAQALAGLPLRTVVNESHRDGQMTSVHAGLAALQRPCAGVMICLADQPLLSTDDYVALIDAFGRRGDKSILVPTHDGQRGNPIVLADEHRGAILDRQANLGCRHLVDRNPDLVMTVAFDSAGYVADMDTAEDYRALADQALPVGSA